jgi:hypothetical protein
MLTLVSKKTRLMVASMLLVLGLASSAYAALVYIFPASRTNGVDFWTFVLKQPAATNPLLDENGSKCRNGQTGQTFWLVGSADNTPKTRTCTVPGGKSIAFPLINSFAGSTADDPPAQRTVAYQRSLVDAVKNAKNLKLVIDGQNYTNLRDYLVESNAFSITLGPDNIFGADAGTVVSPAVDKGFYVRINPFIPFTGKRFDGKHTIYFHAELDAQYNGGEEPLIIDVTYNITQNL